MAPFDGKYLTSYLMAIVMLALSLIIYEILQTGNIHTHTHTHAHVRLQAHTERQGCWLKAKSQICCVWSLQQCQIKVVKGLYLTKCGPIPGIQSSFCRGGNLTDWCFWVTALRGSGSVTSQLYQPPWQCQAYASISLDHSKQMNVTQHNNLCRGK